MRFIRTDALKPGMILDADIIGPRGELLLAKGQVLSLSQITRLMAADFEGAYITDEYPEDEPLVEGIISRKLKENTVNALSTFFKTVNRGNPRGTLQAFDKLRHYCKVQAQGRQAHKVGGGRRPNQPRGTEDPGRDEAEEE